MVNLDGNALTAAAIDFHCGLADGARQRVRAGRNRAASNVDSCALLCEGEGYSLPYTSTGAGDHRNLA
jgi:hypothetical protein